MFEDLLLPIIALIYQVNMELDLFALNMSTL